MPQSLTRAADLTNSFGVNAHLNQGEYSSWSQCQSMMEYLGCTLLRDAAPDSTNFLPELEVAATAGYRFSFICGGNSSNPGVEPASAQAAILSEFETAYPGSIFLVEGPGEPNNTSAWGNFTYDGVGPGSNDNAYTDPNSYVQPWIAYANDLATHVKATSNLSGIKLAGMCCYPNAPAESCDYANIHYYNNNTAQPPESDAYYITSTEQNCWTAGLSQPFVVTEVGYVFNTTSTDDGCSDPATLAKNQLTTYYELINIGAAQYHVYSLSDFSGDGGSDYGLFDSSFNARPQATAFRNHFILHQDTGSTASTFTPSPATFTASPALETTPYGSNVAISNAFQKSNGRTLIQIWPRVTIWNGAAAVAPTSQTITLTFNQAYRCIWVFDPVNGKDPVQQVFSTNTITITLHDRPLILALSPPI